MEIISRGKIYMECIYILEYVWRKQTLKKIKKKNKNKNLKNWERALKKLVQILRIVVYDPET